MNRPPLDERDKSRYWSKVDVRGLDECWPWKGHRTKRGYGIFSIRLKNHNAQRVGMMFRLGEIPNDIFALHSCDNPCCQNPCHVFPGSHQENMADKMRKGRHWVPVGENGSGSKLNQKQVDEIREKYASGRFYQKELGAQYGVRQQQIHRIVRWKEWAH